MNGDSQKHAGTESDSKPVEIERLLPPRFLANDPDFVDRRVTGQTSGRVLLPDAAGGVQAVDDSTVRIEHQGRKIELVRLSPEEKRKRQLIINVVAILAGLAFLVLVFRWL